jgi:CPA2 family monovalent cation:H+ antiporter-2
MHAPLHLTAILTLLGTAVIVVALFRKLHISPVLGYLVAGAIIGPGGIGIVPDVEGTTAIAEFGVVFLLFVIGLELSWERLRTMRKNVFAVGTAQVAITISSLAGILYALGFSPQAAIIIAGGITLSSTALVMQLIEESGQKASQLGRLSLAILLVQDLAVVPLLVLVPALASEHLSLAGELGVVALKAIAALLIIMIGGRLLLRPIYRLATSMQQPEIFTALTLLVVLGTGWLTFQAGLSLALGAFIAGLLMAETEYRHQVAADMLPFKGLFLGLFFMAVGMSVNLHLALHQFPLIVALTLLMMAAKAFLTYLLCRAFRFTSALSLQAGLLLSQSGEFAFILFGLGADNHFLSQELAQILMIVVTFSMALTPLVTVMGRLLARTLERVDGGNAQVPEGALSDIRNHVIILGFGRVGQTIAKLLSAENIPYIALDMEAATVAEAKKIGLPVYYGDGGRREVLHAIGIERASAAIVTVNEPIAAEGAVLALRAHAPTLPIIARARDLKRVQMLEKAGANLAISEMFETSLQLGGALLKSLGINDQEIVRITEIFRDRDYALARGTLQSTTSESQSLHGKAVVFQQGILSGAVTKDT